MEAEAHIPREAQRGLMPAARAISFVLAAALLAACSRSPVGPPPAASAATSAASQTAAIAWTSFDDAAVERARREHRYLLLGLESDGCVPCRTMERRTYRDPLVVALIAGSFVAARANVDARPDLEARYGDKWPATVIFSPDGRELARYQGFIAPAEFAAILSQLSARD